MAEETQKTSYPMLPVAHWWTLRDKFKQSIPGVVTDTYLASALNIARPSARGNILPYLKAVGLIDDEGKPLELTKAWRDDNQYGEVCKRIREKVYPEELLAVTEDPHDDREAVERWFSIKTGLGRSAVSRMVAFYIVLFEGDISKKPAGKPAKKRKPGTAKSVQTGARHNENIETKAQDAKRSPVPAPGHHVQPPGVHINIEIHISSDASPDQIDKIFESMSKHIYDK